MPCIPPDGGGDRLLNIPYSPPPRAKLDSLMLPPILLEGGPRRPMDGIGGKGSLRGGMGGGMKSPLPPRMPISPRGGIPEYRRSNKSLDSSYLLS